MTLTIYGVLRSRATRNVWLANELGLPFAHVPVIQASRLADPLAPDAPLNTRSPAFRAVNPDGLVPCIADDGLVLSESLAINLYLAKKHGGPLAPRDLREDALTTAWTLWAATGCEPHAVTILVQRERTVPEKRDERAVAAAVAALAERLPALEAALAANGGHVIGERFTVADLNLAEVLRYARPAPELFARFPRVTAWIAACQARPAFKAMWAEREAEPA